MPKILDTKVRLFKFSSEEPDSLVRRLANIADPPPEGTHLAGIFSKLRQTGEDAVDHRQRIIKGLIQETGGGDADGVPLRSLSLERFGEQYRENSTVRWVIVEIILEAAAAFLEENPEASEKLNTDPAFADYPGDTKNYVTRGILQYLGIVDHTENTA